MIPKAAGSDADVVVIDLEDAVVPDAKVAARESLIDAVSANDFGRSAVAYRINAIGSPWCLDDLTEVVRACRQRIDVVVIPKVVSERDVWFVDDVLGCLEASLDLEPGSIGIEVLVEEPGAVVHVAAIAASSPRVEALVIGVGDLAAGLGMRLGHIGDTSSERAQGYPGDPWHHVRCQVIAAARSVGVQAIDGPYSHFADGDGFRRDADGFALLGGSGKWCIHPSQVGLANVVFSPSREEFEEAVAVLVSVREAAMDGRGAAVHDGRMIDAASVRSFEATVRQGRAAGLDG